MKLGSKARIECIKRIDFGEIDGDGDPHLEKYFLDDNYWDKIINNKAFFVIGKKGTGKSSIYRMIEKQAIEQGHIIKNADFGEFPFHRLLELDDESFSTPNQYQSIWKNLILNMMAQKIAELDIVGNCYFDEIKEYVNTCIGRNIVDLHKEIIRHTVKQNGLINFHGFSFGGENERSITLGNGSNNITQINSTLFDLIINFLMTGSYDKKLIIQFDRLDDNYNQYQKLEQYYNSIISLFKVVYRINQEFRARDIENAKIVIYLRSDIYRELSKRDAESARWDDFKVFINWAIINRSDWENPKLLQMINKRIHASLDSFGIHQSFNEIFDLNGIHLTDDRTNEEVYDLFKYIINRTLHRPRDLVKFCKCIQLEVKNTDLFTFNTIKNAEKTYSDWFLNQEIANEINPVLKNTESLHEMMKLVGSKPFSLTDFHTRYKAVAQILLPAEDLAFYLYSVGIIENIEDFNGQTRFRSSYRNQGKLDRNMKMIIHPAVWKGLNV
ncbi:hypothetical protein CAFE_17970 [Caprobacter fermentans]|uniref:Uncharacterized protein n=1 Tax=Caproicibacter fermentans TaxID=2576756 RepID=A0A6N8HZT0_9FIRM|nr:hypothetical protein [Caproicibacter fermentans]MVB11095.1 hypothetical protein [Caproicibacter fermentans]